MACCGCCKSFAYEWAGAIIIEERHSGDYSGSLYVAAALDFGVTPAERALVVSGLDKSGADADQFLDQIRG
jgi:hypothetical protein